MTLARPNARRPDAGLADALAATLQSVTKLRAR